MAGQILPRLLPVSFFGQLSLGSIFLATLAGKFHPISIWIVGEIASQPLHLLPWFRDWSRKRFIRHFLNGMFVAAIWLTVFPDKRPFQQTKIIPREPNQWLVKEVQERLSHSNMPKELQSVSISLVLGGGSNLSKEMKKTAKETGVLHLFAASGLHLGVFLLFLSFVFKPFSRIHPHIPTLLSFGCAFVYLWGLDFPVSFTRAFLFFLYIGIAKLSYRKTFPVDLLLFAACIVLFLFPNDFGRPGFLLSFGAVFGIFMIKPYLEAGFKANSPLWRENLILSFACSFATFPILAVYFHSFSFLGLGVNLIAIPISSFLLPSLYISLLIDKIPLFGELSWSFSDLLLRIFLRILLEAKRIPNLYQQWNETKLEILILYFVLLSLIFVFPKVKVKQVQILKWFLVIGFFPFVYLLQKESSPENRTFSFFRKGNAILSVQKTVSFLGNCYAKQALEAWEKKQSICHSAETIYLESESCLPWALPCANKNPFGNRIVLTSQRKIFQDWKILSETFTFENGNPSIPLLKEGHFLRYSGDRTKVVPLLKVLRAEKKGILLIDLPPWSKETIADWKSLQKILGISEEWVILNVEEALAHPAFKTN